MSDDVKRPYLLTDEQVRTACGNLTLVSTLLEGFAKDHPEQSERSTEAAAEIRSLVDYLLDEQRNQKAKVPRG